MTGWLAQIITAKFTNGPPAHIWIWDRWEGGERECTFYMKRWGPAQVYQAEQNAPWCPGLNFHGEVIVNKNRWEGTESCDLKVLSVRKTETESKSVNYYPEKRNKYLSSSKWVKLPVGNEIDYVLHASALNESC